MITDIIMNFEGNKCRGESLIRNTLSEKQKFTEDVDSETFRNKCEQRLFTRQMMKWSEIEKRAAILTKWQWHHQGALDTLKNDMLRKEQWRDEGGYINKGPFEKPSTSIQIIELGRDADTGEVTLKVTPIQGDEVYYEIWGVPTTASARIKDFQSFKVSEMHVSFLCVDSTGEHETGNVIPWSNKVTLQKRIFGDENIKTVELKPAPPDAIIRYTTDGSNPKNTGGIYRGPFEIGHSVSVVLAVAEKEDIESSEIRIDIDWKEDAVDILPDKLATWRLPQKINTTKETYELKGLLEKYHGKAAGVTLVVVGENWVDLNVDDKIALSGKEIERAIESLREIYADGQVGIEAKSLVFDTGQDLKDFADAKKIMINMDEVAQ